MIRLNGMPINITMFPDKTSQVWQLPENILNETNFAHITWEFENEGEIMHLAQLCHLLTNNSFKIALNLKYLPYGRQDKPTQNDQTFALYPFMNILNTMHISELILNDPHSNVAQNCFSNRVTVKYPKRQVERIFNLTESDIVCYPDKGAKEKYTHWYDFEYIYGDKVRDQKTGYITNYTLHGDCKDKNVLIVDDICDGGMTFKILTKDLLQSGAKEVNLFVSHGIFSKGIQTLKESGINRIFTIDGEKLV